MRELMLKPGWPGTFRRTVALGKKTKTLEFKAATPVEVTEQEAAALAADIGIVIFDVERDEKNRPRFVEIVDDRAAETMELNPNANVANV